MSDFHPDEEFDALAAGFADTIAAMAGAPVEHVDQYRRVATSELAAMRQLVADHPMIAEVVADTVMVHDDEILESYRFLARKVEAGHLEPDQLPELPVSSIDVSNARAFVEIIGDSNPIIVEAMSNTVLSLPKFGPLNRGEATESASTTEADADVSEELKGEAFFEALKEKYFGVTYYGIDRSGNVVSIEVTETELYVDGSSVVKHRSSRSTRNTEILLVMMEFAGKELDKSVFNSVGFGYASTSQSGADQKLNSARNWALRNLGEESGQELLWQVPSAGNTTVIQFMREPLTSEPIDSVDLPVIETSTPDEPTDVIDAHPTEGAELEGGLEERVLAAIQGLNSTVTIEEVWAMVHGYSLPALGGANCQAELEAARALAEKYPELLRVEVVDDDVLVHVTSDEAGDLRSPEVANTYFQKVLLTKIGSDSSNYRLIIEQRGGSRYNIEHAELKVFVILLAQDQPRTLDEICRLAGYTAPLDNRRVKVSHALGRGETRKLGILVENDPSNDSSQARYSLDPGQVSELLELIEPDDLQAIKDANPFDKAALEIKPELEGLNELREGGITVDGVSREFIDIERAIIDVIRNGPASKSQIRRQLKDASGTPTDFNEVYTKLVDELVNAGFAKHEQGEDNVFRVSLI